MRCVKCNKKIEDDSKFCRHCGVPQKKQKYYRRSDGLYEKIMTVNGKRVAFRGKTEKEVEHKMLEYTETKEKGELFSTVADRWEDEHFPTLAYNSLKSYTPALARAKDYFNDIYIQDITLANVKAYIASLPKTWAQKTLSNYFLVLNLIFEYAAENELIERNPAEYAKLPKGRKKTHRRAPTEQEIKIIKENIDKPFGLFAFFLLYTGCRRGEALAIQYKDIDRKNKLIHITKSVYHDNNHPMIKAPKTEKGHRSIVLLDILAKEIPKGKADDYIFADEGNLITSSQFTKLWNDYRKETGLEITPHIVRHGYASILHEAGIDPKDAQALLGHANISTTLDIYTHITEKQMKETAKKLNHYINNSQ